LGADGIIINLPSNDTINGINPAQSIDNYDRVIELATAQEIVVWIATTQPRNFISNDNRDDQIELRDLTISNYPHNYVNFWTRLAQGENNAFINPDYNSGDDIHLNDGGHEILFRRVIGSGFIESLYAPDPSFINIDVDESDDEVDISWETDIIGSTIFQYGTTTSLGTSIPETNTHIKVKNHSFNISGLNSCTEYYYELASNGAYFNNSTSTIQSFTTTGCPEPEIEETPSNRSSGSNVSRRINNLEKLGKQDKADDLRNKYSVRKENELTDVNFSNSRNELIRIIELLIRNGIITQDQSQLARSLARGGNGSDYLFTKDLELNDVDEEVRLLQQFLNSNGFVLAQSGPGSTGNETNIFGTLTQSALIEFQISNDIKPSIGYFGPITRSFIENNY
jgi:hypothetical protein